jgi:uncharacterized protein
MAGVIEMLDDVASLWKLAAAFAGVTYGIYGSQLFLRQRSIVFKPTRDMIGDPSALGVRFEDVSFRAAADDVHGWWIEGSPANRAFLFLPGSIGNISGDLATFAALRSVDAGVLAIDYPGFGASGGTASEAACYAAADAAWRFLVERRGIDPDRIVVYGRSVGAAVAAWLAAERRCAAVVCHSPLTSIADVAARAYPFVPARLFCYVRFDTGRHIARCRCPVVVMHSDRDTIIPVQQGYEVFAHARPPKRFLPLVGDHYGDGWLATPHVRAALRDLAADGSGLWT